MNSMDRLKVLKQILFYLHFGWRYWIAGMILIIIGIFCYFLIPYIIKETYVITSANLEQAKIELNRKQLILNVIHYISIGFISLGFLLSIIIGETYAGYATIESIRLKNFDKNNFFFDYSFLCLMSCFLLPFIFLYYSMAQVRKEINFVTNDLNENKNSNLITEEEWNMKDFKGKLEYLDYLLDMNIITKNEHKFLVKDVKQNISNNKFYDAKQDKYIGSDEFNKSILEEEKEIMLDETNQPDFDKDIDDRIYA